MAFKSCWLSALAVPVVVLRDEKVFEGRIVLDEFVRNLPVVGRLFAAAVFTLRLGATVLLIEFLVMLMLELNVFLSGDESFSKSSKFL